MLKINTQKLIQSIIKRGMSQAHLAYQFTICKSSKIPTKLKKSIKENSSNFFDGGADIDYLVLKVPETRKEPADATSKIVQMIKTNFLEGDPNNTFTTSDVQVGFIEFGRMRNEAVEDENDKEEDGAEKEEPTENDTEEEVQTNRRMFYVLKYKISD